MKRASALLALLGAAVLPVLPILVAVAGVIGLSACASCGSTVRETPMPVLAAGAFDGVEIDQSAHRLYLADSADKGVDVVDISTATPRFVQTIDVAGEPNGLAVAPDIHRLYAGLIGGSLAVIDTDPVSPQRMRMIDKVVVDKMAADLLDYSPRMHRVYVSTGLGGDIVGVDTNTNKVMERLTPSVPVEQPRYNPADGMIYATSSETDSIVRIDPASQTLNRTLKIDRCRPSGLAINPTRQLAMASCEGSVALVNLRSWRYEVTRAVPGGDIVTYDAKADRFLVASPHGKLDSAVAVFYGDGTFLGSVGVPPRAHAAAFDATHGLVYAIGATGVLSFAPRACEPPPDWLKLALGSSVFLAPLAAFALFLVLYARRMGRAEPAVPTWDQLQKEDLAAERERIKALEDAIYGPQVE